MGYGRADYAKEKFNRRRSRMCTVIILHIRPAEESPRAYLPLLQGKEDR